MSDNAEIKRLKALKEYILANLKECANCHVEIKCKCIFETHIRPKNRSCALPDGSYPMSKLDSEGYLIHICSSKCANEMSDAQYTKNGLLPVRIGGFTSYYNPKETSYDSALNSLRNFIEPGDCNILI